MGSLFAITAAATPPDGTAVLESEPYRPAICTGWIPSAQAFGFVGDESSLPQCPPGHVFMSELVPAGHPGDPRRLRVTGACCAYPPDALTESKVHESIECPPDHVVTGIVPQPEGDSSGTVVRQMICTKINTAKYRLGAPTPAIHVTELGSEKGVWNWVLSFFGVGYEGRTVSWTSMPAGIRYALGRKNQQSWDSAFCAGHPWGSALTGKSSGRGCSFQHKELLMIDPSNRGAAPKPVKIYPDCLAVEPLLSPTPHCVTAPEAGFR